MIFDASFEGRTIRLEIVERDGRYIASLDGRTHTVDYVETGRDFVSLLVDGTSLEVGLSPKGRGYAVVLDDDAFEVVFEDAVRGRAPAVKPATGSGRIMAPMPGRIVRVLVSKGDEVGPGQALLVIEAMKMENELRSPFKGKVQDLPVREGQAVETGALLLIVE